jgi:nucleoside phosphorylase
VKRPDSGLRPTAVVLTALELEHAAVVAHLSRPIVEQVERGLIFDVGTFSGRRPWRVAVAQAGPGNPSAGVLLERAVSVFAPEVAMFVGIAGGRKDVRHGDVVAADAVYDYESGKDDEDRYLPRIKTSAPSFALVQRAQAVARRAKWPHRIKPAPPKRRPSAFVKPIAAGGKVVAHDRSNTAQLVAAYCGDALAVDMESYGFLRGAYVNDGVATLVVRGISDLLSDKTAPNDERWQVVAARHAAAFAFEVLASADVAATGSAGRPPAATWIQNNQPVGGTVYANQGGNQTIYVSDPGRGER